MLTPAVIWFPVERWMVSPPSAKLDSFLCLPWRSDCRLPASVAQHTIFWSFPFGLRCVSRTCNLFLLGWMTHGDKHGNLHSVETRRVEPSFLLWHFTEVNTHCNSSPYCTPLLGSSEVVVVKLLFFGCIKGQFTNFAYQFYSVSSVKRHQVQWCHQSI